MVQAKKIENFLYFNYHSPSRCCPEFLKNCLLKKLCPGRGAFSARQANH